MNMTIKESNKNVVDGLTDRDFGVRKEAEDNVSKYLRIRQREEGYARKFFNVQEVGPSDLHKQVDTPLPVIVKDMEPNSAGAYSVPFGQSPMDANLDAPRYRLMFDRIMSRRYVADVNELLTYDMDIRQIFNDFILKDILAEEDRKFMLVVEAIVGTVNVINPLVGACQWITAGALSRETLAHAMKGLPSTKNRLNVSAILINNVTIWDVVALNRLELGGDLAEEMFLNGFIERNIMGVKWLITIKSDLVADHNIYEFAAPEFLGDFAVLDNVTMSSKHEDFIISFFAYECVAAAIMNIAAVAKVSFTGSLTQWR